MGLLSKRLARLVFDLPKSEPAKALTRWVRRRAGYAVALILCVSGAADQSATFVVGNSIVISVTADGTTPFTYQWNKNGSPIGGATSGTFSIASATSGDAGNYTVTVSNSAGSTTSDVATLSEATIPTSAPVITTQPTGQTVTAGSSVSFTVAGNGTPTPVIQWQKNGVDLVNGATISGANSTTLSISSTTSADAGTYTAILTNAAGTIRSNDAVLGVNVAPQITTQPSSQDAPPGATVKFTVTATGTPAPLFRWKKNGVDLFDGGNVSGATTATLTITGVTAADEGSYTATASNSVGSAVSNSAILTFAGPGAPTITLQPSSRTAAIGATVSFSVAANGTPAPTIQWQKDGSNLFDGANVSGATTTTLTLIDISPTDAGVYTAFATNIAGTAGSSGATLMVGLLPSITTQPRDRSVTAGANVNLSVAFTGSPTPTVRWSKAGVPLTDAGNIKGSSTATLSLTQVTASDAGAYTAAVTNSVGTVVSQPANLTVSTSSFISSQPTDQTVAAGGTARFTVVVTGNPAPSIQWQKDGVNLSDGGIVSGAQTTALTLTGVTAANAGVYRAVVTNSLGSATSNGAQLTVNGAPTMFGQLPSMTVVSSGTRVTLAANAGGTAPLTYLWKKDGADLNDGGTASGSKTATLTLSGVGPSDSGKYTVTISNSQGSFTSNTAEVVVLPSNVSSQPVTVGHTVTLDGGAASGALQWQVLSGSTGQWTNLSEGGSYRGTTGRSLEISNVSSDLANNQYRLVSTSNGTTSVVRTLLLTVDAALLPYPVGLAIDTTGNVYVADTSTDTVRKLDGLGQLSLLAGTSGSAGTSDGVGSSARFNDPTGLAYSPAGVIAITDNANATIRVATLSGSVTTLAGSTTARGNTNGTGGSATFSSPSGIASDSSGSYYVADSTNHTIRKVTATGTVTTFAGTAGVSGSNDGVGAAARFNHPTGITVAPNGNIYVSDTTNNLIRKITADGTVTTFAGLLGVAGSSDGMGSAALFNRPTGLASDAAGNVYVADSGNSAIRKITPDGMVTTLAGLPGIAGLKDGVGSDAWFNQPLDVKVAPGGVLFVADTGNAIIRRISMDGSTVSLQIVADSTLEPLPVPSTPSVPEVPSTPSFPTTPTLPTGPTSPTAGSGGGGGGGATSEWFVVALLTAWLARRRHRSA